MSEPVSLQALPGGELVERGLADLARDLKTPEAALIEIARTRLRSLGLPVPELTAAPERDAELRLYELLGARHPERDPYPLYCAWLERLDSFLSVLTHLREQE